MAIRYLRKSGNDSNGGTSPGDAWLTFTHALGGSALASGDTLYVGGGIYRETVAVGLAPGAETFVIGDPTGAYTGDPGEVILTGYTSGDTSAGSGTVTLSAASGRNNFTFERIAIIGADIGPVTLSTNTNWTFRECVWRYRMASTSSSTLHTTNAGSASNLLFERCIFFSDQSGTALLFQSTLHTVDYDVNIQIINCIAYKTGGSVLTVSSTTGSGSGKPYGWKMYGCTVFGGTVAMNITTAAHAATGSVAAGNFFMTGTTAALTTSTGSQVASDFNRSTGSAGYSGTTPGGNDDLDATPAHMAEFGQSFMWGLPPRPFLTPTEGNPHAAFVTSASVGAMPTTDALNRPRRSGSGSATAVPVGAYAIHNTAIQATTITPDSGEAIELVGPADHEFDVPVEAASTTFTVEVQTSGYTGTDYPQMLLLNGAQVGVSNDTDTATSASASGYETLSIGPFTPTATGIVTVRFVNRTANGTGIAAFDTFTVT
jgi:hypothetical protein